MVGYRVSFLTKFNNLRWFQQWGAGADWLMEHPELVEKEFILTNVSGLHAVPISEHIFSFMLAFARDLPRAVRARIGENGPGTNLIRSSNWLGGRWS